MRVSDTLRTEAIVTGVTWADFAGVVEGLVERLIETGALPRALGPAAIAAVIERERVASTAMVDIGVSIPHSRLEGLPRLVSAVALAPDGVYGAKAGTPISIVFLVLSPSSLVGDHLSFLSALSMLLHSAPFRRSLQEARTAANVYTLIQAAERR